ncbi:MAG TPA: hypothetical protein VGC66_05940 [Pyrinomonadaceae bacterium]|jgi:hypothetical protein
MHDCRKTKEALIDLVFNEMDAEGELHILEEMEACRGCRAEYHSMQEALSNFDEAAPAMLPAPEFWAEHHARIEERLSQSAGANLSIPFWRRAFRTSFSVPVPAAIAAALLLAATSVMAVRSFIFTGELKRTAAEATAATVQIVEVPVEKRVVEERVVTRTVYVNKRAGRERQNTPSLQTLPDMTASKARDEGTNAPRATLNGFQPPSDVKLTVIKGSFNDDK